MPDYTISLNNHTNPMTNYFYVCIAGDTTTWKDPVNYFRKSKLILIINVPTMEFYDGKKIVNKLTGDDEIKRLEQ